METLRLRCPIPGIDRTPVEPTQVNGVTITPGTDVLLYFHNIHLDERYFKNAKEFIPERWLETDSAENSLNSRLPGDHVMPRNVKTERQKNPWIFLPFSGGERNCIGQKAAMQEAEIFLSMIVKKFEISSKSLEETKMFLDPLLTPLNLKLQFTRRMEK
jgi:cytochrome P450